MGLTPELAVTLLPVLAIDLSAGQSLPAGLGKTKPLRKAKPVHRPEPLALSAQLPCLPFGENGKVPIPPIPNVPRPVFTIGTGG
jgi:hypothetical protein